jgi:ABC-type transport system involved in multi-copper enzyme maturation permease subunit
VGTLIGFFLRNEIRSRRLLWTAILGLLPVGIVLLLWAAKPILVRNGMDFAGLFRPLVFFLFFHLLLPLVTVFSGTSILVHEVEEKTLPLLLVRPIPRWTITVAKSLSAMISGCVILLVSMGLTHAVLRLAGGTQTFGVFVQCAGVFLLGFWAYLNFFSWLGGWMKKPVIAGLFFALGLENVLASYPGNVKYFTIIHYIHRLLPFSDPSGSQGTFSQIMKSLIRSKPLPEGMAVVTLIAIGLVFGILAALFLRFREYQIEGEE